MWRCISPQLYQTQRLVQVCSQLKAKKIFLQKRNIALEPCGATGQKAEAGDHGK